MRKALGSCVTAGRAPSFATARYRSRAAGEYARTIDVELLYRQQLNEADRRLIGSVAASDAGLVATLGSAALESAVFDPGDVSAHAYASPFLTFAVAVHRTAGALETATFVEERLGSRRRIPVFDVASLRAVLGDPLRRYFFVELLASYTRVSSGVSWRRTALGWRRQRFSELDPVRLAALLDEVGPGERVGVYRRLGDLCLFLLGVFPDHPPLPAGAAADRLLRHGGVRPDQVEDLDATALFELLGATWYRAAAQLAAGAALPLTGTFAVVGEIADQFRAARRVLNAVTDRYLFPLRSRWFPG